ncbi:MAG: EamA family transporter, partial [Spirochaetota bacterium]
PRESRDLAWGAAAGLSGLVGLGMLYRGLATGAAAIVSPTAALVGTAAPILAGVLMGEAPTPVGWSGIALALPAILLLSLTRRASERIDHRSLALGVLAGIGFGGYFILIDRTGEASGFWPLVAARVISIPVIVIIARASRRSLLLERHSRQPAVIAGVLDMTANVFFLIATRIGLLVTSAVISSLYPAPTVVLARAFDHQTLGVRRWTGLALALVGLSLMAVG